jgi:hypothetical protein
MLIITEISNLQFIVATEASVSTRNVSTSQLDVSLKGRVITSIQFNQLTRSKQVSKTRFNKGLR